ncbi:MAG: hypothetical protein V4551_16265 [Pseudomonadota bacterium]
MNIQNAINITVQERMIRHDETEGEQANPDFYRMALELTHLDELSDRGWWANWGGCMYAETVIRAFGGIVADAALACEQGDEGSSETTTVALLDRVDAYLHWQGFGPSSDDEVAGKLIDTARAALDALRLHLRAMGEPTAQH